jgi:hypothetical protein
MTRTLIITVLICYVPMFIFGISAHLIYHNSVISFITAFVTFAISYIIGINYFFNKI